MASFRRNTSIITPSVREAIIHYEKVFSFMYSHPITMTVDTKTGAIFVTRNPFSLKLLSWAISFVLVTTLLGFGCCSYIVVKFLYFPTVKTVATNSSSQLELETTLYSKILEQLGGTQDLAFYHASLMFALGICVLLEMLLTVIVYQYPEIIMAFNELMQLERRGK